MNIHRHAYNSRGAEYYSEDPILTGYIGSAVVRGAQSKGTLVNIKHAAFNDRGDQPFGNRGIHERAESKGSRAQRSPAGI